MKIIENPYVSHYQRVTNPIITMQIQRLHLPPLDPPSGRARAVAQVADACSEADARAAAFHLANGVDEVLALKMAN